ncbi:MULTISPECIES: cytochrome b/b6 domain-containing protein [Sphingomonadales]|uniref:Cytochrome B561 n=3 Tax=Sphingomonadaceae TaxID=41297 RepID=A0A9J9HEI6_RHIWR|nr:MULTISPECIES: cytochrome b/b6 domain-containing protein [Sphingomonadaceae]ABQ70062.1 cytochrome B561 [Rhizorhabdus wittichii RW1]ARR57075.1 cytochrome B [Rhizorhabdus wittichii DC-6]PJG48459.1 cytochrome B [Sphingobium sp. LB126]QTH24371.1 cytochrome b/b6 domain-containing protein [Rhizorhabdus wittichii]UNK79640.1 cytochrome b/b6 domain-containing protein [Sphingopyxis granuli]
MAHSDRAETFKVWDAPLRLFHWLLVAAITIAFLSSESDSPIAAWHMVAGWSAAVLIAFRLIWGLVGGEHARFVDFIRPSAIAGHIRELLAGRPERAIGHNPLGAIAVIALIGLTGVVLWSGIAVAAGGMDEDLHEALAYGLLALIGIHVGAVLLMSAVTRENLVRAMIGGRKKRALHPGAQDARAPGIFAMLLGVVAIVLTSIAILKMEPMAFSPQHREAHHGVPGERD